MTAVTGSSDFRYRRGGNVQIGSASAWFQTLPPTSASTRPAAGRAADPAGGDFAAALTATASTGAGTDTATAATGATASVSGGSTIPDEDRYAPNDRSTLSYLTPDDRRMIKAATGFIISSDGIVQNPNGHSVDPFISILSGERMDGKISGSSVTPGYLRQLFAKYGNTPQNQAQNPNAIFNPAYLDRALDYLAEHDRQHTVGTPRSSFTVAPDALIDRYGSE